MSAQGTLNRLEFKMLRYLLPALALTGASLALAAPASAGDNIRLRNVSGYSVLDEQHVLINAGASRHYLATLRRRCHGLRFGMAIRTSFGRNAYITNPHFEYVEPTGGHRIAQRCYLDTLEQVEDADAARALIDARAQEAEDDTMAMTESR
jgi:hypothetical protein